MAAGYWDQALWDVDSWWSRAWPPGASWRDLWTWRYQYRETVHADGSWDLTQMVVEARWQTDTITLGDGTLRGDIQPGTLALRLQDQTDLLAGLSKLGAITATFQPTGASWWWAVNTVTRELLTPTDPTRYNIVVNADAWPARLTTGSYSASRPAETVSARLAAIASRLDTDNGLYLPDVYPDIAADGHTVAALAMASDGSWPPFLQQIRDAAANGVAWVTAAATGVGGAIQLTLHYRLWDAAAVRVITDDQIIAGPPVSSGIDDVITKVAWDGTRPDGTTHDTINQLGGGWGSYGIHARGPLRVWGLIATGGADNAPVTGTGQAVLSTYGSPDTKYVDSVSCISGDRSKGGPNPTVPWDPTVMVWQPHEVLRWHNPYAGADQDYRVTGSQHVLNAKSWSVVHALELAVAATPWS